MDNYWKNIIRLVVSMMIAAVIVAILTRTSVNGFFVETANDWIGYWGSCIGAFLGAAIPLYALHKTTQADRAKESAQKKRLFCNELIKDVDLLMIQLCH